MTQATTPHHQLGEPRHWLLDLAAGRDFLIVAAARLNPQSRLSYFRTRLQDDPVLDDMIDRLGLRTLPPPQGRWQQACASAHFTRRLIKLVFTRTIGAQPPMGVPKDQH